MSAAPTDKTAIETKAEENVQPRRRIASPVLDWLAHQYLLAILIVVAVAVGLARPSFWSAGNLTNILFQASFVGLAACGMTLLIASGLLDLSVGGTIAVSAVAATTVLPHTTVGAAIALAVGLGAVLGLLNGLLVTYVRIPPFIATLGTLYLFLGVAFIWTSGHVVPITSYHFRSLTTGTIGVLPVAFLAFLLVALLTFVLLNRTYFGRTIRAYGSNPRAAELAGMRVNRTKVLTFIFAGVCAALAGIFMAGRLSSAEGNMAIGFEMDVIAAVVVGGTALRGGRGTVFGTILGALLFAILANSLNLLGVASYWQYVLTGTVLAVAVALGARRASAAEVRGAS